MSELMYDIYNDAFYAARNSGASESEARAYAEQYCHDMQSQLVFN